MEDDSGEKVRVDHGGKKVEAKGWGHPEAGPEICNNAKTKEELRGEVGQREEFRENLKCCMPRAMKPKVKHRTTEQNPGGHMGHELGTKSSCNLQMF